MPTIHYGELERLRYWQGQTLRSRDARDQARFDARRRQLHNRAVHSAEGVAFGLAVQRIDGDPSRRRVACGVAYDCWGRELLLQRSRDIQLPTDASWLILRYRQVSAGSSCCGHSDLGCVGDESLLLDRDVELVWVPVESFEPVRGVALAKFTDGDLDPAFRPPQARPLARPRLARGQTVRGNTPWEPWIVDEPDGQGGLRQKVVGVQTHIDTSAAGFTRTPCYLAAIDAPAWDVATAEFAPAFFPHVADPSVDGFTFRLLMVETTRRRYATAFGTTRVADTSRGIGDGLQVDVDSASAFQKGDVVALLRPRARSVVRAKAGVGKAVTLAAALDEADVNKTVLAIGNLPRIAKVSNVQPASATMVADFVATPAIKKGDVLLRTNDGATAVIDSVSTVKKQLTVTKPFADWKSTDVLNVARLSKAVKVVTAAPSGASLDLTPVSHTVNQNLAIVLIDGSGTPLGVPRKVTKHTSGTAPIDVTPVLTPAEAAAVKRVGVFTPDITVGTVQLKSPGITVDVDSTDSFDEGDFVAAVGNTSAIAAIKKVSSATRLELDASIPVVNEGQIVAANWLGAATVASLGAPGSNTVTIGRTNAVPPQDAFVVRRNADDSFSAPSLVKDVKGATLTLDVPIADLARLDTLAIGAFPRIVTVLSQQAEDEKIQILATQAGMLSAGDELALIAASDTTALVAQVTAVNGSDVVLGSSLGRLTAGQTLAIVNFRDRALLTKVNTSTSIEIDAHITFRDRGDVVGLLTHYVDNSNPGLIERIEAGNRLVLAFPQVQTGDGIVSKGWIDGGIIGQAAVAFAPSEPAPELRFQPFVRLVSTEGLDQVRPAVIYGLDLETGRFVASSVLPFLFGGGDHIFVWPGDAAAVFRYRPETLSLITTFNTDFPRAFATFAQKQQLAVSWMACQEEFSRPTGCPAQQPFDVCDEP